MRFAIVILCAISSGWAADEVQLALALKAQTAFDRVQLVAAPQLADTYGCIQSQAALLPVASRTELPLIRFRKGYCGLVRATLTHRPEDFKEAAADFDGAIQAWPARIEKPAKGVAVEPVSSALPVLAAIARLEADPVASEVPANAIRAALSSPACPSSVMATAECQGILTIGRDWLGWIALRDNRLDEAAVSFSGGGWTDWVAGRQAFTRRNYSLAAAKYRQALQTWERLASDSAPALEVRLGPRPDLGMAFSDLGGAQLLAGDPPGAIATLDAAIKRNPDHAWNYFLRARAREAAGQSDAALTDYNLASRTAFAGAKDLVSGEAHLYRGVMLYRRKDFSRAEDEFSSALNFEIPAVLRPDAVAWRHLAAVAGGACGASREQLQRALPAASPYFPAREAQTVLGACPSTQSVGAADL